MNANIYHIHDDGSAELLCGPYIILLDAEDVEKLSAFQWNVGRHGYASSGCGKNQILMHRLIINAREGTIVDHINRNKLDNRKCNIRKCTVQENSLNRGAQTNNQCGLKGVCKTADGKWQAQINFDGKAIYLGRFDSPEDASIAYDNAAIHLFGQYAYLNGSGEAKVASQKVIRRTPKLKKDAVEQIRMLYDEGWTVDELAKLYNHSYSSIHRVVKGRTFRKELA